MSSIIYAPALIVSACVSKIYSLITGIKPIEISKESFVAEIKTYASSNIEKGIISVTVCNNTIHMLCRHATVFSNYPPVVIINEGGSFNYVEFMESFPKIYDVYCIDLPGMGISSDPAFHLEKVKLENYYAYYAQLIMNALYAVYPAKNARFTFIGDSFGALLMLKTISSGFIPYQKIHKFIMVPYQQQNNCFSFFERWCIQTFTFKQWLFSPFLYRKKTQLETIQQMQKFLKNSISEIRRRMLCYTFEEEEVIHTSKYCYIDLIIDGNDHPEIKQQPKHYAIKTHELDWDNCLFTQKDLFPKLLSIIESC